MFSIAMDTNHLCAKYQQQRVDTAAKLENITMLTLSLSSRPRFFYVTDPGQMSMT